MIKGMVVTGGRLGMGVLLKEVMFERPLETDLTSLLPCCGGPVTPQMSYASMGTPVCTHQPLHFFPSDHFVYIFCLFAMIVRT